MWVTLGTIAFFTPVYIVTIRAGLAKIQANFREKEESLRKANKLDPSRLEQLMAVLLTLCKISNLCCKWEYMTLIFMFNPCHIVGVSVRSLASSGSNLLIINLI